MPIVYVIILAVGLANVAWWRWADQKLKPQRHGRVLRALLATWVLIQILYLAYFVVAPNSARRVHPWIPMPVVAAVYIWNLIVLPASWIGIAICTLAVGIKRLALNRRSHFPSNQPGPEGRRGVLQLRYTRRQVLITAAVATPPIVTALAVARAIPQLEEFRIRSIDLAIPGLPPNLDGVRIAHLSDIHVGRYTRRGILPRVVEATNQLNADLVLFTGDLIDLSLEDLDRGIDTIKQIDPRHGLALIEGNHDLIENADEFDRRTKASGLPLLVDETMTVSLRGERIQLLGTRWGTASGDRRRTGDLAFEQTIARLQRHRKSGAFPILLAHHPHAFDPAATAGFPLTLSGHTHGGQLMLSDRTGFGPLFFRYWSGVYRNGTSQLVVSNGIGNWFPLRINAPAEIVQLTLHSM